MKLFSKKKGLQKEIQVSDKPKRQGNLTHRHKKNFIYASNGKKSIIDYLPWVEFDEVHNSILLEDGRSVGAVFEIIPYGTEAKSISKLRDISDIVTNSIEDTFDERDTNPWIIQYFCQDEDNLQDYISLLRQYPKPHAKETEFTKKWLSIMEAHLDNITKKDGLFFDNTVTKTLWRGQIRKTRLVIYRYLGTKEREDLNPQESLDIVCNNLTLALKGAGIVVNRLGKNEVSRWLAQIFNPSPLQGGKNFIKQLMDEQKQIDELPIITDFAENLFYSEPEIKEGYWHFDNTPHAVVVVDRLKLPPKIGHITGETSKADGINALFDVLPESTMMCLTIVTHPQDKLEDHINFIRGKAIGENAESLSVKEDCAEAMEYIRQRKKMYYSSVAFYVKDSSISGLKRRIQALSSVLNNNGLVTVAEANEVAPASSFLRWLPMNYNPQNDPQRLYVKFNWCKHLANLLPVLGRSTGTGHPGVTFFNRGGEPLSYDPMVDKAQNGHKLILGPTGAGKSATLNIEIAQLVAMYRPRMIIVETGNSFGLLVDFMEQQGVSVYRVCLKPGSGVVLNPLADSHLILQNKDIQFEIDENNLSDDIVSEALEQNDDEDAQRDVLGEIEISIRLMITGGEEKEDELLRRSDRAMIRQAIVMAAQVAYAEKRQAIPSDVQDALFSLSKDVNLPEARRAKAYEMAESLSMFTQGFEGEIFNQQGTSWPDVDVIHVDLATFAREGYEAQLSIAYISLINHINNMGEQYQHQSRAIVNITDESHIITVKPLTAAYLTKASKMWRKLGVWLWLATQNMEDFPDAASKLLSMIEWWEMLVTESSEAEKIRRFKALTDEQISMITSACKSARQYTEGVVLSKNVECLFRIVPPSLFLALAMTEKDEKAERMKLMKEFNISELDAAIKVSEKLDEARGISSRISKDS
ncbi:conjugative transfer ATPase [Gilliamella sp. B2776]|uniref:conjugative transfer ATPase n=1 Tax=unclassified Gilliamella TaxID=2685620 RepID=UPI00226A32F0|nr:MULTISPECIES: conjugative transfer ATPase [unclassified Gilliamella]MCX8578699.1 conjugative transfer ATPase [Gilliamella sp. B2717]MCX8649581.1 conjugative transfer ATPase [Gilliamella sp. B2779]MCX8654901.1 conjugative transfer ATPase [Gilliamella sp. B2737]MCX8691429.1 conjugative transfer ATPase [Gilliamella sp. B2776]MCX8702510.1 conjugative transfer ATPase [Gilliamella sp. B2781]